MRQKFRQLFKFILAGLCLLTFSVFILKAPEFHKDLIRSYVGDKTVILRGARSGGTGFHVTTESGETLLVTNKHVCDIGFKSKTGVTLYALTKDGRFLPRKVLATSTSHDLCALQAVPGYSGLTVSSSLRTGDNIAIVGHPKLYPLQISRGEFIGSRVIRLMAECQTKKIVVPYIIERSEVNEINVIRERGGLSPFCVVNIFSNQITAYSRGGSSGSPVVNFYGDVVGVLFAGNRMDQFDSYMVPLFELQSFLEEL